MHSQVPFDRLAAQLQGKLYTDSTMKVLYATDASAYRELPSAVAIPETVEDLAALIRFASTHKTSLIPRTAGTSLAGQVVGSGIVVDVSKYFNNILEVNQHEGWVRVQPGVVRDVLNMHLKPYGLYFGPETSTANRAMVGGMVGNNSCGSNSIVYGSTREHLLEATVLLSDGAEVVFKNLTAEEFYAKRRGEGVASPLEQQLYEGIYQQLSDEALRHEIQEQYPNPAIPRRNTGYALDLLAHTAPFKEGGKPFNFCALLAGSEGTLAIITELKLRAVPLPPPVQGLLCVHFESIDESLRANLVALTYKPSASELIDRYILDCTKDNIEQSKNRFFVLGDPGAILVVELSRQTLEELVADAEALTEELKSLGLGYHYPLLTGADTGKIWTLRKAGLGLLSNMPGDAKPVPVIEDTAVTVEDLPAYIREFNEKLAERGLFSVHYAHAGTGEIHLRPILNLKTAEGQRLFRVVAEDIASLVKKYKGSLSGEHGDGRLRAEFIKTMLGDKVYAELVRLKHTWDPQNIFNPGKIVHAPPMDTNLRYDAGQQTPDFTTVFDFSRTHGVLRHAEQCNGSGDCRKTHLSGGTMCPSYMVTRNERDTTRARANVMREFLTRSTKENRFDHEEIKEAMDLCISCKGCKAECPSNVDVSKLKAEFLQHYYDANGVPLRTRLISKFNQANQLASLVPGVYNFMFGQKLSGSLIKKLMGIAPQRELPTLQKVTLREWFKKRTKPVYKGESKGKVWLFCDEFTNFNDTHIGQATVQLLERLGYEVAIPEHLESGRTMLSKGLLREARDIVRKNIDLLSGIVTPETPLIGIEPSAILGFRDEYIDLAAPEQLAAAELLARNSFLLEEFIANEAVKGAITSEAFTIDQKLIKVHGHCHQKALSSLTFVKKALSLPANYQVHFIPSGCCGMAGSFGYEKEHYEVSMQIGELVLFPAVRKLAEEVIVAAPGTSCRHQIKDGTGRIALHPAEILLQALKG
jgi:FAD/FMN-containing dehydrogenase/Fe-S oxidoreductase